MSDLISRQAAIHAICRDGVRLERGGALMITISTAKQWAVDLLGELPSAQPDEEKISDLLYDVYRLTCPQLGTGGVAVLKSYISMIYKEIFGEEGPGWMKK